MTPQYFDKKSRSVHHKTAFFIKYTEGSIF
jgi:hypothetical protein